MSHERILKSERQLEGLMRTLMRKAKAEQEGEAADARGDEPRSKRAARRWIQGYSAQAAVDADLQVIVAIGVSNQASDAVHLMPMLERIEANTGQLPYALIADAGYCSTANLEACKDRQLNTYISTSRQQHGHRPRPSRGRAPRDLDVRGRMDRKLRFVTGQTIDAFRKWDRVVPYFSRLNHCRRPSAHHVTDS
jgi:hypothetical protein